MVGYAMAATPEADIPWHRVINSQGRISPRTHEGGDRLQRLLLEAEGIEFDETGRVDLSRAGWRPRRRVSRAR
jgi:methylated-DNA-protein-cysteine methyltransferase-like protein